MARRAYSIWAALLVHYYKALVEILPAVRFMPGLPGLIDALLPHWLEWRVETTMAEVDQQAAAIADEWQAADLQAQAPIVSEAPPDGSQAQELLGGELRIRSPWVDS